MRKLIHILLLTIVCSYLLVLPVCAMEVRNEETGYRMLVEDFADLLTDADEELILRQMEGITEYGNIACVTIDSNSAGGTESWIRDYYEQQFGKASGAAFIIDMDYRNIWIYSDGAIYRSLTKDKMDTITDNIYTYASDEDYYECCSECMEQILSVLHGERIAQPMKYMCNALLAILLALLINFFVTMAASKTMKPSERDLLQNMFSQYKLNQPTATFTHTTKEYSPQSSGGGGSHGGGGGGGGHSGGGGGHSF